MHSVVDTYFGLSSVVDQVTLQLGSLVVIAGLPLVVNSHRNVGFYLIFFGKNPPSLWTQLPLFISLIAPDSLSKHIFPFAIPSDIHARDVLAAAGDGVGGASSCILASDGADVS